MAMELGLASLGHVSLDGSKFKADTSKHKAMTIKRLKEKEKELMEEVDILIQKVHLCNEEEDKEYSAAGHRSHILVLRPINSEYVPGNLFSA
ncbi:MAG: hypothetical protein J7J70_10155, partial [Deltaproteobacteria bacterium]|nr:hypothetical protein [Candidatus Tharpellaceae bacterium]